MRESREPAFGITIYRDEPDEANVESRFVGCEDDPATAIREARSAAIDAARVGRWHAWSATVDSVIVVTSPIRLGSMTVRSTTYEDPDHGQRWSIGPTWTDGPESF